MRTTTMKKRKAFDYPARHLRNGFFQFLFFFFFSDVTRDIQKMAAKKDTAKRSGRKNESGQNQFFFIVI